MPATEAVAPSTDVASAPDWSAVNNGVPCPLCDYDLRGLSEPRCPECGYRFSWHELLDPKIAPHAYLFEHHPRRNILSFLRTLRATWRPRTFWRSIAPTQPISFRRLLIYWFVVAMINPEQEDVQPFIVGPGRQSQDGLSSVRCWWVR